MLAEQGQFEKFVTRVLTADPQARVELAEPDRVVLVSSKGKHQVMLRHTANEEGELLLWLRERLKQPFGSMEVALIGGSRAARKLLKQAMPFLVPGDVVQHHLADDGTAWKSKSFVVGPGPIGQLFRSPSFFGGEVAAASKDALSAEAIANAEARLAGVQAPAPDVEVARHLERQKQNPPYATITLAIVITLMFGLEYLLGGSDRVAVLARLGAVMPERVKHEPWRLLSYSFLHVGFMHWLLNTYVLFAIGLFLEGLLGTRRFLVIYALSALGGGAMVWLVGSAPITAGASGAIWGMLAAEAVIAFKPRGLLPTSALPGLQKAAMTNLALNVVNSFRPEVSFAGHLGGGLVGAALVAAPMLLMGLPRIDGDINQPATREDTGLVRGLAGLSAGALFVCLVWPLVLGGALDLLGKPRFTRKALTASKMSLEITSVAGEAKLEASAPPDDGTTRADYTFGSLDDGPSLTSVVIVGALTIKADEFDEQFSDLMKREAEPDKIMAPLGTAEQKTLGGRRCQVATFERGSDHALRLERVSCLEPDQFVRIESFYWTDDPKQAGLSVHAAETLKRD